jgi:hypothetical protein
MRAGFSLNDALLDGRVFLAGQPLARGQGAIASGWDALDAALPWGGFPRGALTEILHPFDGVGELDLVLPAWRALLREETLAMIAPPYLPYAPGFAHARLPLERLLWIDAPRERAMWAAEQCLRAGCLGGAAVWNGDIDVRPLRRLQLAAEEGGSVGFVLRPAKHAGNPSPAALRLQLLPAPDGLLCVQVLKSRGATPPIHALQRGRVY